jgi:hypothetical protein
MKAYAAVRFFSIKALLVLAGGVLILLFLLGRL